MAEPLRPAGEIQLHVNDLDHDGRGVARREGKAIFVEGALPGETVGVTVQRKRRKYDVGRLERIIAPSPARVTPRCAVFGTCGGCRLQHLSHPEQIERKQHRLLENLLRIGDVRPETVRPALTGATWHYRRRARLSARYVPAKGGTLVGFRERHKSFVTDMSRCEILVPKVAGLVSELRTLIDGLSCPQRVPQIEVAEGDNALALVLRHLEALTTGDEALLAEFARTHQLHLYTQHGGPETVRPLWPEDPEPLYYDLPDFDLRLYFRPVDFIQINGPINRALVSAVVEMAEPEPERSVLDLFCGLGNFSLALARQGADVIGLENEAGLLARARENAVRNGVHNVQFLGVDLFQSPLSGSWIRPVDVLLLDPPRVGAVPIMGLMNILAARRVVYVSCAPATLARDARVLVHRQGYRFCELRVVDMFPHTAHIEAVALFER